MSWSIFTGISLVWWSIARIADALIPSSLLHARGFVSLVCSLIASVSKDNRFIIVKQRVALGRVH